MTKQDEAGRSRTKQPISCVLVGLLRFTGDVLSPALRAHFVRAKSLPAILSLAMTLVLLACAASTPPMPYPAFIQVEDLPDTFIAGLPGVRAKQLAGNPQTRRSSNQILLPADWQFTTGASPGKSVEIFVLAGEIVLGDLALGAGGYAYIPPGSIGLQMTSSRGASLLYFLDDADPAAVIQTPLILSSDLVSWMPLSESPNDLGLSVKELRADPGSGARTWLKKIDSFAIQSWQQSSTTREGFLIAGSYHGNECINGVEVSGDYGPGGYFHRTPGAVYGGPGSNSTAGTIWFLRSPNKDSLRALAECVPAQPK